MHNLQLNVTKQTTLKYLQYSIKRGAFKHKWGQENGTSPQPSPGLLSFLLLRRRSITGVTHWSPALGDKTWWPHWSVLSSKPFSSLHQFTHSQGRAHPVVELNIMLSRLDALTRSSVQKHFPHGWMSNTHIHMNTLFICKREASKMKN